MKRVVRVGLSEKVIIEQRGGRGEKVVLVLGRHSRQREWPVQEPCGVFEK